MLVDLGIHSGGGWDWRSRTKPWVSLLNARRGGRGARRYQRPAGVKKLFWWGWLGLNRRPTGYEPAALTTELHPQPK